MSPTVRWGGSATICITPCLTSRPLVAEAPSVIFPERCCGNVSSISPKSVRLNVQTFPSKVPLLKFDPAGKALTLTTSPAVEDDTLLLTYRYRGTGASSALPRDDSAKMGGSTGAWCV